MWATDDDEGSVWMGGLVIDQTTQGRGIGRAAVKAFIDRFTCDAEGHIALSYDPENGAARSLYASLGFVETGEMEGDEIVARYRRG
jgi:diamine N-acetyltransferase